MVQETQDLDFRSTLKRELERRLSVNPRYSLRAFARDIGLSPSRLSHVLKGHYGLSEKAGEAIASRLGLSVRETDSFIHSISAQHGRSGLQRDAARRRLDSLKHEINELTADAFMLISEWYHLALLEYFSGAGATANQEELAVHFKVSSHQISSAIERMCRLGVLKKIKNTYRPTDSFYVNPLGTPSDAVRNFHKQILQKALISLSEDTVDVRDMGVVVLNFDPAQIPKARKVLKDFRIQFENQFNSSKSKTKFVYTLSTNFFSLVGVSKKP